MITVLPLDEVPGFETPRELTFEYVPAPGDTFAPLAMAKLKELDAKAVADEVAADPKASTGAFFFG